jgi:hypothetical protein
MADLSGFVLVKDLAIPELNTRAKLLNHTKTGAELLALENDDENKVFGITFRTPVGDSSGIPHILEHSVLCGSRKYPVKEPFVELLKGSLNTFGVLVDQVHDEGIVVVMGPAASIDAANTSRRGWLSVANVM